MNRVSLWKFINKSCISFDGCYRFAMIHRFYLVGVFLSALLLRIWGTPRLDFGLDQQAIFQIGKTFFDSGDLPVYGPKLVYTGESIPGGFQALVAGVPLFFSEGKPIGLQLWTGILNWLSMLILFLTRYSHQDYTCLDQA